HHHHVVPAKIGCYFPFGSQTDIEGASTRCALYPQKRTFGIAKELSAHSVQWPSLNQIRCSALSHLQTDDDSSACRYVSTPHPSLGSNSQVFIMVGTSDELLREAATKVAEVTLVFWIIKIAATTLGETGGDSITMTLNWGYLTGTLIFLPALILLVV